MCNSTKMPEGATREQGIAMLHDHELFLSHNPHMTKFEALASLPQAATPAAAAIPEGKTVVAETKAYQVTDLVHTLPSGLWDSNIVSTYEFTDLADGMLMRIRSPLSVTMSTVWEIAEVKGEPGRFELVEKVSIEASRLLIGVVKSTCEKGWRDIHSKMLASLKD